MKKLLYCLLVIVITLTVCGKNAHEIEVEKTAVVPKSAAVSAPEGIKNIKIKNSIAVDIYELYVCPSGTGSYGADILGNGLLPQNEAVEVSAVVGSAELWDVKVLAEDGLFYIWDGVPLGADGVIELCIADETTKYNIVSGEQP